MTVSYLKERGLRTGTPPTPSSDWQWVRPTDWLPLTDPVVGENKIVELWAVFPNQENWFVFASNACPCSIDFGDGAPPTALAANTTIRRQLNFNDYSSSTMTTEGYRQAIVTITATSGAFADLYHTWHSPVGWSVYYPQVLDIRMAGSSINTLPVKRVSNNRALMLEHFKFIGPNSIVAGGNHFLECYRLGKCEIDLSGITDASAIFESCYNLREVVVNAPFATTWRSTFVSCFSLRRATITVGLAANSLNATFANCASLVDVEILGDTSNVTNHSTMFSGCYSLAEAPSLNTAKSTTTNSMFANCVTLQSVPLYDTGLVGDMTSMFSGCRLLKSVPHFNTANVTTMSNMFNGCSQLPTVPLFNTANVQIMTNMFYSCAMLESIPTFNTVKVTAFNGFMQNCTAITTVPALDTSVCIQASNMFWTCSSLRYIAPLNFAAIPNAAAVSQVVGNNGAIQDLQFTGLRFSVSIASLSLSAAKLDAFYAALGTAASAGQTVTVSGNYGTTGDTPSIATAKGWTVSGS